MGDGSAYTEWLLNGKRIGGGTGHIGSEVRANWMTYFTATETDGTVKKAQDLGGKVLFGPATIPQGRFAILSDPQGAVFAIHAR